MITRDVVLGFVVAGSLACAPASRISSVYSDLSGSNCRLLKEDKETGATVHRCKGVAGWDLLVQYDDQRMSVSVVHPDGAESALDLWKVVTKGFLSLGSRAEWRVRNGGNERAEPVALIVRVNTSDQTSGGRSTPGASYLVVANLQRAPACVTDKITAGPNSNERAREAADRAPQASCLSAAADVEEK